MKRCKKCGSELKESPHNQVTGYESYRCNNIECNALFDISDLLVTNYTSSSLIKPDNLKSYQIQYFDRLVKKREVQIPFPLYVGKAHLILDILEFNKDAFVIVGNNQIKYSMISFSEKEDLIKDRIFNYRSKEFRKLLSSGFINRNFNYCLILELSSRDKISVQYELDLIGFSRDKVYNLI